MAEFLNDGEFWLPPRFLTEESYIDNRKFSIKGSAVFETPFLYGSDLGSPVESLFGSTENESDEEDMLADLSRNMARSTLDEGFKNSGDKFEERIVSRSPQSTLRASNLDLLCQAVGEVANRRLNELYARKQHSSASVPLKPLNSDAAHLSQNSMLYHQLLDYQIQHLKKQKQQMIMKQHQQQRSDSSVWSPQMTCGRKAEYPNTRNCRPMGLSPAAWPSLQQAVQQQGHGPGMTSVFLGAPTRKRECSGTGVFLPRRVGPLPELRKKPACSTALLPAKAMHALNLENVVPQPLHLPNRFNGGDVSWKSRSNSFGGHPNRSVRPQPVTPIPEISLPQEWTY